MVFFLFFFCVFLVDFCYVYFVSAANFCCKSPSPSNLCLDLLICILNLPSCFYPSSLDPSHVVCLKLRFLGCIYFSVSTRCVFFCVSFCCVLIAYVLPCVCDALLSHSLQHVWVSPPFLPVSIVSVCRPICVVVGCVSVCLHDQCFICVFVSVCFTAPHSLCIFLFCMCSFWACDCIWGRVWFSESPSIRICSFSNITMLYLTAPIQLFIHDSSIPSQINFTCNHHSTIEIH